MMREISVGVLASANPWHLEETLSWLAASTVPFSLKVFDWEPAARTRGSGHFLNRLVHESPAHFYFLVESGALPSPHSLEAMTGVFRRVASCGIVGPTTNLGTNEQAVLRRSLEDVERNSATARMRFGTAYRSLHRNSHLENFCLGFRHEFLKAVGPAKETPDWISALSTQAEAGRYAVLWVCGAYVHRKSLRSSAALAKPTHIALELPWIRSAQANARDAAWTIPNEIQNSIVELQCAEPIVSEKTNSSEFTDIDAQSLPLVSCIMPTFNRRAFFPRAMRCFLSQDYPNTELIVVDDGTDPVADLLPPDPRIRYFRHSTKQNVGAKRNFACEQAHGEYILHWDDDEWYGPSRVRRQINSLQKSHARVAGTSVAFFYNEGSDRAFRYCYVGASSTWMGALAYPRHVWKARPFDCIAIGEDVRFISRIPVGQRMDLKDPTLYVASIHDSNTSPKITKGLYWKPEPIETIRAIPGFVPAGNFVDSLTASAMVA
jgi:hypothetical protein